MNKVEAFAIELYLEEARKYRNEIVSRANFRFDDVDEDGASNEDKFMQSIWQLDQNLDGIEEMVLAWHKK
tara:strand:- start:580 stop:789 length:210 start_codon:yes stop_codon:yes gene_type:complete